MKHIFNKLSLYMNFLHKANSCSNKVDDNIYFELLCFGLITQILDIFFT